LLKLVLEEIRRPDTPFDVSCVRIGASPKDGNFFGVLLSLIEGSGERNISLRTLERRSDVVLQHPEPPSNSTYSLRGTLVSHPGILRVTIVDEKGGE